MLEVPVAGKSEDAEPTRQNSKKRGLELPCFGAVSKRPRSWLQRDAGSQPASWRPAKLYRQGAKAWLVTLDNQIQQCTRFNGLAHFQWRDIWLDWRRWPSVSMSVDLGSDGTSAWHSLAYHF